MYSLKQIANQFDDMDLIIFSCIQYQEIRMKLSIYQTPLKDISAIFINNAFQKIWESSQSCRISESSSWIALGGKQVFKFRMAFYFSFKSKFLYLVNPTSLKPDGIQCTD